MAERNSMSLPLIRGLPMSPDPTDFPPPLRSTARRHTPPGSLRRADPARIPLQSIDGGITFITSGQMDFPAAGGWLAGHEPDRGVTVRDLPAWATNPDFVPPARKPRPKPLPPSGAPSKGRHAQS